MIRLILAGMMVRWALKKGNQADADAALDVYYRIMHRQ